MMPVFIGMLNMSITATWITLAVLVCRLLLRKAPKWTSCLLWAMVAVRLLIPGFWESSLSLIPSIQPIPEDIAVSARPAIHTGISSINDAVNPVIQQHFAPQQNAGFTVQSILDVAMVIWLMGLAAMLVYGAVSYWKLRRQVRISLSVSKGVYLCDDIEIPFILGTLRPRIYIPSGMDADHLQYVLAHERAHLKRKDHWWKPLGFLLLSVHWFNPVLWAAYILLCRDIEQACDEKAIRDMENPEKVSYSQALVGCSSGRMRILACPLAFGETSLRHRVKAVLSYRKPVIWVLLASLAVCGVTAVCFLTNPRPCAHDYHSQIALETSCTHPGETVYTCSQCWQSYTQPIAQLSHSYSDGVIVQESTCAAEGVLAKTCEGCGAVQEQSIPMHQEHTFTSQLVRTATCTEPGECVETCVLCGKTQTVTIEKLGHTYVKDHEDRATCDMQGRIYYSCKCGANCFETTPRRSHEYVQRGRYSECKYCGMLGGSPVIFDTGSAPKPPPLPVIQIWP